MNAIASRSRERLAGDGIDRDRSTQLHLWRPGTGLMQRAYLMPHGSVPPLMEAKMKTTLITLLLLSLALTGCIVAPGPGYGGGYNGGGYYGGGHAGLYGEHGYYR